MMSEPACERLEAHSCQPNSGESLRVLKARSGAAPLGPALRITRVVGLARREGETTGERNRALPPLG